MSTIYYTEDHEWLNVDGDTATIGISTYAAGQLGDVVFVELPEVGKTVKKGDEIAVVESVKSASEIYAPVSGEITASNAALEDAPETVNEDAQGAGWFFKMTIADRSELSGLMDEAAYGEFTKE
ncbi:MAG: glycine cleavage system protein H [Robiginitomaculum sp.]|nr:MAG: glycine cleavage system protein H [Robiginitomaculum sp.]